MPSYTSNFERQIPSGNWPRSLWIAFIVTLAVIAGWEVYWRGQGYAPTLNDTYDLWSANRSQLGDRPDRVVIIGSSRILFDVDMDAYASHFNARRPIQLSVVGTTPLLSLEHLANDESFVGTVLCGIVPGLFFVPQGPPVKNIEDAIRRYENWSPSQRSGNFLGIQLQRRLAFLQQEDLTLNALLASLPVRDREKVAPNIGPKSPPYFYEMDEHRQGKMWEKCDFDSPLAITIQNRWIPLFTPPPPPPGITPDQFKEMYMASVESYLERARASVEMIRGRGGRVVFIRCPSTGTLREMENAFSPRSGFWDRLLVATDAPGIHFEDYPELAQFDCPEWSHLIAADATQFTKNLMPILQEILETPAP